MRELKHGEVYRTVAQAHDTALLHSHLLTADHLLRCRHLMQHGLCCARAKIAGAKALISMQVYPRTGRFKDMSSEIEVELAAFSLTVIATVPASAPAAVAWS